MPIQTNFFSRTKKELYLNYVEITNSLIKLFEHPPETWIHQRSNTTSSLKSNLDNIYVVNQSIIGTIKKVKADLYEGKINNSRLYYESDLHLVDVIINIYSQFSKPETVEIVSDVELLKDKILAQIHSIYPLIEQFPEDIATNVKARPRIISKVSLDYYQLIYLVFCHTQSQINEINLVHNIAKITAAKLKVHP